ncbi:MAG: DNA-directed RNA polymerase subunit alpha [Anaerolineae bacterium]
MLEQVLPRIERETSTRGYGRYRIGPMQRGYGDTVGIALRRVLLSSISGAAITTVRVSGVAHEYSSIPGAQEDMLMFLLNLKQVRLISHADGPVRLRVSAKGKTLLTAGDIECPADVDIVNPELQLLTLDTVDSDIEIEMTVERGMGYSPSEERKGMAIGEIPVDAIFSPILKVNTDVEAARVEQRTDYDMLKLEIWTDGTITPEDALKQASRLLMQHFTLLGDIQEPTPEEEPEVGIEPEQDMPFAEVPIEDLELSQRAFNCLKRQGIANVGEIIERLQRGTAELLAIRNFGQKSLEELLDRMREKGFIGENEAFD